MTPTSYAIEGELRARCEELVTHYPQKRAALIPVLHEIQEIEGWLPPESLSAVATFLELPLVQVYEVVTFYPLLRTQKPGKHVLQVCHNISCDLRGSQEILSTCRAKLGIGPGQTTPDGKFTLETMECMGACDQAPMLSANGRYHLRLTKESTEQIIDQLAQQDA